jgi:hypothetical protein
MNGTFFEVQILDRCTFLNHDYFSYRRSLQIARESQPRGWDPCDPHIQAANDLHYFVFEAMGIEEIESLKLYTALNTPLDYYHGVDCFFEFNGEVVTIDLTLNLNKPDVKADVRIDDQIIDDDKNIRENYMKELAREIAKDFMRKAS